ncbi:MAG TPA: hypothetical protein VF212_05475 [Longimicrobiales bacterium]
MSTTTRQLLPTDEVVKAATLRALKGEAFRGALGDEEIERFLNEAVGAGVPSPIQAEGDLKFIAIYGKITCQPSPDPWKKYYMDETAWGIGGSMITSLGFMYTAYETWDAFFKNTTAYHAQGIADAGGIFQINWFNSSGVPVGQYNAAAGGIAVFQCGGSCTWKVH